MTSTAASFAATAGPRARVVALTVATAAVSIAGALATAHAGARAAGDSVDLVVLCILLSISLTRERAGSTARERLRTVVTMPLVGLLAGAIGALMVAQPVLGDALYVVVVSGAIWLRRFGAVATRLGTLVALPFVAVLVAPVPVRPSPLFPVEAAIVALIVVIAGGLLDALARATRFLPTHQPRPAAPASPRQARGQDARPRRLPASTRMAAQMAVALTAAFLAGHLVFGEHWPWLVVTAYIVSSGNRGRGDVFYKGVLRVAGALGGTVVGSVVALVGHPGDPVLLVALAVVLVLALWLRPLNYAWWAAGVTSALALLYDYTGTVGGAAEPAGGGELGVLLLRLAAIVVGGLIASLAAGFVLPVRTIDVVRRRTADALAALSAVLAGVREAPVDGDAVTAAKGEFDAAVGRLHQLAPALRAHRVSRRGRVRDGHPATLIELVGETKAPVGDLVDAVLRAGRLSGPGRRAAGLAARRVGDLRRSLGGRDLAGDDGAAASASSDSPPADEGSARRLLTIVARLGPEIVAVRRPVPAEPPPPVAGPEPPVSGPEPPVSHPEPPVSDPPTPAP